MENRRFLVVDDDTVMLTFVKRILMAAGAAQILLAKTGEEGVALAEQEHPDLIILDVRLPAGNGLSVLRRLKESASTSDIPVLMATGETDFRPVCDERHASAVLSKPFTQLQLLGQIARLLPLPVAA